MSQHTTKPSIPDSPTDREMEMRELVREFEQGDEGLSDFCRSRGIKKGTFTWWQREVRRRREGRRARGLDAQRQERVGFVEVIPAPRATETVDEPRSVMPDGSGVRVVLPHGLQVEIDPGFDEETLLRAIQVLESISC